MASRTLWVGKEPKGKFAQRECTLVDGNLRIFKGGKLVSSHPLSRSLITSSKFLSVPDRPNCFLLEVETANKDKKGKENERLPLYLDAGDAALSSQLLHDIRVADPLRVFYVPLELSALRSDSKKTIPRPWRVCIKWLNAYGLDEPHLYCVPGSRTDINTYIQRFDADEKEIEIPQSESAHTVSSVLVHCLTDDLWNGQRERFLDLSTEFHNNSSTSSSTTTTNIAAATTATTPSTISASALTSTQLWCLNEMRRLIASHPRVLRASLRLLFEHFCLVAAHSATNEMTPAKLAAAVFPRSGPSVTLMIQYFDHVFGPPTVVFGESLQNGLLRSGGGEVPAPVRDTVVWLDTNALNDVGLYRIPGDDRKVTEYVNQYDDGVTVVFPTSELSETVASVLKAYIYRMQESLLQSDLKREFMSIHGDKGFGGLREQMAQLVSGKAANTSAVTETKHSEVVLSEEEKLAATKALIVRMAPASRTLLSFLMAHWAKVANNSSVNKMTSHNIALSLYPSWSKTFEFILDNQTALFANHA